MLKGLLHTIRDFFAGRAEAELEAEIAFHLEREKEKLIARGMSEAEAERHARLAFGAREETKERCRDLRPARLLEQLFQDLAFGARMLVRYRLSSAVAILSLALGIGANTAIFQILDVLSFRSLPVRSPEQLLEVRIIGDRGFGNFTARHSELTYPQWEQIRSQQKPFVSIAAWSPRSFNLAVTGEKRPAEGLLLSGEFFDTLGVNAWRGRLLGKRDDETPCPTTTAVISHSFWRREYGAAPDVIGRSLTLDGHRFTIAGITPPSFFGVEVAKSFDVAIPLCAEDLLAGAESQLKLRKNYWLSVVGRLRPGWSRQRANAHLAVLSKHVFAATLPDDIDGNQAKQYLNMKLAATPGGAGVSWLRVNYQNALTLLLGAAGFVLLIACANVANLQLVRSALRTHEMAVRNSLGASRTRLLRQLLTESFLLAAAGAAAGLALASALSRLLVSMLNTATDAVELTLAMNWHVVAFSALLLIGTCFLFGLAPALHTTRLSGRVALASAARVAGSSARSTLRRALVAAEVSLSIVLVTGAIVFAQSLHNLLSANLGFKARQITIVSVDTRRVGAGQKQARDLFRRVLERLRDEPGVVSASQATIVPISGWESNTNFIIDRGGKQSSINSFTRFSPVSEGYFGTLQMPLLAGRDFSRQDTERSPRVAVVNEAFAHRFFGRQNPVGQTFRVPDAQSAGEVFRIVGLVGNAKYRTVQEDVQPIVFFCAAQTDFMPNYARYLVRSPLPLQQLRASLTRAIASVSPTLGVEYSSLEGQLSDSLLRERLLAVLAIGFGLLAGLLASIGIYGVLSYSVSARRSEIGIRMAFGADRKSVVQLVLNDAAKLILIGIAMGVTLALTLSRFARAMLYHVEPCDPALLGMAVCILVGVAAAASYVPAYRAGSIDPVAVLHED